MKNSSKRLTGQTNVFKTQFEMIFSQPTPQPPPHTPQSMAYGDFINEQPSTTFTIRGGI
ncbi:hypothetical protein HanPI659440_Chr10g0371191 [Helianthus annuus]|nr:hypothetical protein HanPI659440_Chr10g0371191 [Helianthus annuus]